MIEKLIQGGPMMIPLAVCSIVMLAVLLDRGLAFHRHNRLDIRSLRAEILAHLQEDRIDEAIMLCGSTPSPVAAVLYVGLQNYRTAKVMKLSPATTRLMVEKAMDDYTPQALHAVELRLNWLATIANVAPLFGMTGTVTGMIRSFGALAGASSLDAGVVGAGISEALVATASGLLIALAAMIPYNSFMNRVQKVTLEIGEAASEMVRHIVIRAEQESAAGEQ